MYPHDLLIPMTQVQWEEPTFKGSGGASGERHREIVATMEELKNNPGRWARVSDHPSRATAKTIKRRLKAKFPEHEFRVETQNGRGVVFARFPDPTCTDSKDVI